MPSTNTPARSPFATRVVPISARIDACSVLRGLARDSAALALYHELCDTRDLTVTPLDWRAMGIELGVCMRRHSPFAQAFEFIRARSVDAHQRSDLATRLADLARTVCL